MVKVIVQGSGAEAGVTHVHLVGCERSRLGPGERVKAVATGQTLGRRSQGTR